MLVYHRLNESRILARRLYGLFSFGSDKSFNCRTQFIYKKFNCKYHLCNFHFTVAYFCYIWGSFSTLFLKSNLIVRQERPGNIILPTLSCNRDKLHGQLLGISDSSMQMDISVYGLVHIRRWSGLNMIVKAAKRRLSSRLNAAIDLVLEKGLKIRDAAAMNHVPMSTLHDSLPRKRFGMEGRTGGR